MGKLSAFLKPVPAGKTKEVFISDRFTDEDGKPVPFVIQAISPAENERLARISSDNKGVLDNAEYGNRLIVACTVTPDLKDTELCKYYGVMDPLDVAGIMLSIGEKQRLQYEIMELNDIKPFKEKLDEAKNF